MKKVLLMWSLYLLMAGGPAGAAALPSGFGKATWGMTQPEFMSVYKVQLIPPKQMNDIGPWAVQGPAPGELTISGAVLGEPEIRSISLGFHPTLGLTIIHVRFRDTNKPGEMERLLPKWAGAYGKPKEQLPGPKVIWEDQQTHIELTYHTVSPRHPTPSDHLALVLWSVPLMEKIETIGEEPHIPDVEKLVPMQEPHLEK
ncbi:MAG: hypothetical protein EPO39_09410 [Candidatus Manganitrophaceae bacterium]|nr:MAG: hypothetical protein EPO39_09410 [Candidatus Manganitrophaceae bacterium]